MNVPLFLLGFLFLYTLATCYVGVRLWQALQYFFPRSRRLYFFPLYLLFAFSFLLGRFAEPLLPLWLSDGMTVFGSYWLAIMYYLFLLLLGADFFIFFGRRAGLLPRSGQGVPWNMIVSLAITGGLVLFGWWNARSPVVRHYEISIPKNAGTVSQIHAVMVSDIHLGKFVTNRRLARLVDTINALHPDLVLLPGDIIDEDVDNFATAKMPAVLRGLHPPLGVYGVLGNHEYIRRKPDLAAQELTNGGIIVLRDRYVKVADSFYIVGRDDLSRNRNGGRKSLTEIMSGIDPSLPIILLDHQPWNLEQAEAAGVDLQLSGHTHRGQLFPTNLITHALYEIDWGYLRKNALQIIVSCGYGTWGPPIRVGNRPEIIDLTIRFVPSNE